MPVTTEQLRERSRQIQRQLETSLLYTTISEMTDEIERLWKANGHTDDNQMVVAGRALLTAKLDGKL